MATNPTENDRHEKWVSRKIFRPILQSCDLAVKIVLTEIAASFRHRIFKYHIMILCYFMGIILTGIGAEFRNNSPNYKNWINTIDCGNLDPCGAVLVISFSSVFEVLFLSVFVSFILAIFVAFNELSQFLTKKFPKRCIGCFVIKLLFLLFLSFFIFLFIEEIISDIKWEFYLLSLANLFIAAGMIIMFYLGLTLNKKPRSNNKNGFWA